MATRKRTQEKLDHQQPAHKLVQPHGRRIQCKWLTNKQPKTYNCSQNQTRNKQRATPQTNQQG